MSIYDRDYMSESSRRGYAYGNGGVRAFFAQTPATKILIIANIACFILGGVFDRFFGAGAFFDLFALSPDAVSSGKVWTFATYAFLHANLLHIFLNMLGLYFMGIALETWVGARRFLLVYFAGALAGGVLWLMLSYMHHEALVGASGAVIAVFAAFCAYYPPVPLTFLIFFIIPVSLKPMTMLKIAAAIEAMGFFYSLSVGHATIAYSAHLGGMAAGYFLARRKRGAAVEFPRMPSFKKFFGGGSRKEPDNRGAGEYRYSVNITSHADLKAEVDRILDKINSGGFSSLTEEERETLKKAKEVFK